ncbi:MAG: hypothetical protein Q9203_005825 [Teloschistes exilis]
MKAEKEEERQNPRGRWGAKGFGKMDGKGEVANVLIVQRRIQAIRDRRAAKEEKERYEKMAERMHRKRVERVKRREKRNKLLKS